MFFFEEVFPFYFILVIFPSHLNLPFFSPPCCGPLPFSFESLSLTLFTNQFTLTVCLFIFKEDFAPNNVEDQAREHIRQNLENFIRLEFPGNEVLALYLCFDVFILECFPRKHVMSA